MTKTKWEGKVGAMLDVVRFPFKHKCPDMAHAGQAKIDWLAMDHRGMTWGIEVKYSDTQSLTPYKLLGPKGVTPLQRGVLNSISQGGLAWLAIGHKGTNELYVWEWPWVEAFIQEMSPKAGPNIELFLSSAARQIAFPRGKPPEEYVRWTQLFQRLPAEQAMALSFSGSPPKMDLEAMSVLQQQQIGDGSPMTMENRPFYVPSHHMAAAASTLKQGG